MFLKKLALGVGLSVIGEKIYEKNKDIIDPLAKAGVDATRKTVKGAVKLSKQAYDKYNQPVKEASEKVYNATKEATQKAVDATKNTIESMKENDKNKKD